MRSVHDRPLHVKKQVLYAVEAHRMCIACGWRVTAFIPCTIGASYKEIAKWL